MAVKGYQNIVNDGLVFSVDAYNTKSYVDGDTNAYNLVSNSVSGGTLLNGVGFDTNSWDFDGVSDYIDVGNENLIRPSEAELNSTGYAVEAWINADNLGDFKCIFCNDNVNQSTYYGIECDFNSTGAFVMHKLDGTGVGGTDRSSAQTDNTFPANTWLHVVFNYTSANKEDFEIYVNGLKQSVTTSGTGGSVAYSPSSNGSIGKARVSTIFDGQISNVRVYNRKLSSQEINQNYNATKWRFL